MSFTRHLALALALLATLLPAAGCGHGALTDQSRFVSAHRTSRERVLFTFSDFAYRPATGVAAFPDGGVPKYVTDRNVIGVYDLARARLRILHAEPNTAYQPGQGRYHVAEVVEPTALLTQGGQLEGPFALETRHWLADLDAATLRRVDLAGELAERGRAVGGFRLLDGAGTLLLTAPSLEEAERHTHWRREETVIPELWVRHPDGAYVRAGATRHLQHADAAQVVYWVPSTRRFRAFVLATGETRDLTGYTPPPHRDPQRNATVGDDGHALRVGERRNGEWVYTDLPIPHDALR